MALRPGSHRLTELAESLLSNDRETGDQAVVATQPLLDHTASATPPPPPGDQSTPQWLAAREQALRALGARRESALHRTPGWLLDQLVSGDGFYPPRLLSDGWFTPEEHIMIDRIEAIVAGDDEEETLAEDRRGSIGGRGGGSGSGPSGGRYRALAMDLLTPRLFGVDVRLVLDDSGSMSLDMFGEPTRNAPAARRGQEPESMLMQRAAAMDFPDGTPTEPCGGCGCCVCVEGEQSSGVYRGITDVDEAFELFFDATRRPAARLCPCRPLPCCPAQPAPQIVTRCKGLDPRLRRWAFAQHHVSRWCRVYRAMGIDPWLYSLNYARNCPGGEALQRASGRVRGAEADRIFRRAPTGSTPLPEVLKQVLRDHQAEAESCKRGLFVLVITDGEANSMSKLNSVLDGVQNGAYGAVQVCFSGLSLVREDLEWFDQEECDGTRIRTIEPFEVEQQQMLRREVIGTEGEYTFAQHLYRALLTNFFPADYDYEAPIQNMRHRVYITLHNHDRWLAQRCALPGMCGAGCTHRDVSTNPQSGRAGTGCWLGACGACGPYCLLSELVSAAICAPLFIASACAGGGYLQGEECGNCRQPRALEACGASADCWWKCACGLPLLCMPRRGTWAEQREQKRVAEAEAAERQRVAALTPAQRRAEKEAKRATLREAEERERARRAEIEQQARERKQQARERERERKRERAEAAERERQRVAALTPAQRRAEKEAKRARAQEAKEARQRQADARREMAQATRRF